MIVRYSRRAYSDLAGILDYIEERSPRGAHKVKLAIKRTIETIGRNPNIGHPTGRGATRGSPVGRYPYLVYWTVEADEVSIVHIRNSARKPWRI
jgi:plasmid stabilization system protein ParE